MSVITEKLVVNVFYNVYGMRFGLVLCAESDKYLIMILFYEMEESLFKCTDSM
jgi:hypothetical protein